MPTDDDIALPDLPELNKPAAASESTQAQPAQTTPTPKPAAEDAKKPAQEQPKPAAAPQQ